MARKLLPVHKLREKAWGVISEVRRREASDRCGYLICITCKEKVFWKEAHLSHFIHGHSKPTYLEPTNIHPSCARCNLHLSGNLAEYANFMNKTYGASEIERLITLSHQVWKPSRELYDQLITEYSARLKKLY